MPQRILPVGNYCRRLRRPGPARGGAFLAIEFNFSKRARVFSAA